MVTQAKISAILFDCDGVLVDSEALGLDDSVTFLREHGFDWSAADLVREFTGYRDDVFRTILENAYLDIHGKKPTSALFEGLVEARRRLKDQLQMVPGADRAVNFVRDQGYALAVASSSKQIYLDRKLNHTGLTPFFEPHIYSAEGLKHGKPAPDIFLHAARSISKPAEDCLVLEDSVQGVKAGLAAGMRVWGFCGGGHCFEGHAERLENAGAHQVIDNFEEFVLAIKDLEAS